MERDEASFRSTAHSEPSSHSVRTTLQSQSSVNWFMLAIAAVITGFGLLIVVPPLVSERLARLWTWTTPHMVLIVLLALAMLALVGLAHQQRYLALIRERFQHSQSELEAHARMNTARLYALLDVSHLMGSAEGLDSVFDRITEICSEIFCCDHVSLMSYDDQNLGLIVRSVSGQAVDRTMLGKQLRLGEGIAGWAAQRREPLLLAKDCNVTDYPGLELKSPSITAAMVVPIVLSGSLVGVINVSTRSQEVNYNDDDFRALQVFAENVGACIRQVQRYGEMRQRIRELRDVTEASEVQTQPASIERIGTIDDI